MPSVLLKAGKDQRLHAGHCWVYAGEVARISGEPANGDAVDIRDHKERFLGRGLLNTKSQIVVRRSTEKKEELDTAFFRRRIEVAILYRDTFSVNQQGQLSTRHAESSTRRGGGHYKAGVRRQ